MEPFFIGYLLLPLGYAAALGALARRAEKALETGRAAEAVRLLQFARKAPFLGSYRAMSEVNLLTAANALEDYDLVEEVWSSLRGKLEILRPYGGAAVAAYSATLIGRGRYSRALDVLSESGWEEETEATEELARLCWAFCRANRASAFINLGRLEEADVELKEIASRPWSQPVLGWLLNLLEGHVCYLRGDSARALELLERRPRSGVPPLSRAEFLLHCGILAARCGGPGLDVTRAVFSDFEKAVPVETPLRSSPKMVRFEILLQAEFALALGRTEAALEAFDRLGGMEYVGGLAFLRAASAAQRLGATQAERRYLEWAVRFDPESPWARTAQQRLDTRGSSPGERS